MSRFARSPSETIDAEAIILGVAAARPRQRSSGGRVRGAPVRERHAAGSARLAALRHQRDERAVGRALALLEALHARLSRRRGEDSRRFRSLAPWPRRRRFRRYCRRSRCGWIPTSFTPGSGLDLQRPPFTTKVILSDGGVYDNLGLETVWKRYQTVLVSDGGGQMQAEEEPKSDWARHAYRILGVIDNQVRALRKRQVIDSFLTKARNRDVLGHPDRTSPTTASPTRCRARSIARHGSPRSPRGSSGWTTRCRSG